jgi:phosphoribosylanthranilate isomerase
MQDDWRAVRRTREERGFLARAGGDRLGRRRAVNYAVKRTRIKVCGIRTLEAARAAADSGVDAVGFVFHAGSRRHIAPADAWAIVGGLPPFVSTVGLFVDASLEEFCDIEEQCPTDMSQLHGGEDEELVRECGPNIIKAIRFDSDTIGAQLAKWDAVDEVAAILVDGSSGGEGKTLDWGRLALHTEGRDAAAKPIILAGGLRAENVAEAIRIVRPWGVDVSSGVEGAPGEKDAALIGRFCAAVRAADAG